MRPESGAIGSTRSQTFRFSHDFFLHNCQFCAHFYFLLPVPSGLAEVGLCSAGARARVCVKLKTGTYEICWSTKTTSSFQAPLEGWDKFATRQANFKPAKSREIFRASNCFNSTFARTFHKSPLELAPEHRAKREGRFSRAAAVCRPIAENNHNNKTMIFFCSRTTKELVRRSAA